MLKVEDCLSPTELEKYKKIKSRLISGEIKKNVLPNTSDKFDSKAELENYKAFLATGITQKLMEEMDDKI